jgi:hypothetical protein
MLSSAKIHLIGESLEEFSVARDSMAPVKYVAVIHAASRRGRPP